jgi:hypothetical protein
VKNIWTEEGKEKYRARLREARRNKRKSEGAERERKKCNRKKKR